MGRTIAEYQNAFGQLSDQKLSKPFETKAAARHGAALANKAVRMARDVFVKEITMTWTQGFKELKAQNDQMQRDLAKAYKDELQSIDERLGDIFEAIGG